MKAGAQMKNRGTGGILNKIAGRSVFLITTYGYIRVSRPVSKGVLFENISFLIEIFKQKA